MFRKLFLCGLVLAAGAVVWNEYRLWTDRSQHSPLQSAASENLPSGYHLGDHRPQYFRPDPDFPLEKELAAQQGYDRLAIGGEEPSEPTVIDLTRLQRQTIEPPTADTEEPGALPLFGQLISGSLPSGFSTPDLDIPLRSTSIPVHFRQHSADSSDCCTARGKLANLCKRIASFVWGVPVRDGNDECAPKGLVPEQLIVMPRPLDEHAHHGLQQAVCPYLSGTAGAHYRHSGPLPAVRLHGEEAQAAPPAQPKPEDKRKLPKLDTMEIRPGDLPSSWPWRPF